jgi:hypothetical protein
MCSGIKQVADNINASTKQELVNRSGGRFRKINLTNLTGRGSLEFRQHSGTTEFKKISNWIVFLMQFVEKSQKVANGAGSANFSKIARLAWLAPLRKGLQEFGFDLTHKRYSNDWILKTPTGVEAHDRHGLGVQRTINFGDIESFLRSYANMRSAADFERFAKRGHLEQRLRTFG